MAWWIKSMTYLLAALLLYACAPATTPAFDPSTLPTTVQKAASVQATAAPIPTAISLPTQTLFPIDGPLSVEILYPPDNITVDEQVIEIKGTADPGTVVTINDFILLIDETETFTQEVSLEPGANLVEIIASDGNDNQEFYYLTINYETSTGE